MKLLNNIILAAAIATAPFYTTGCKTTPAAITYKTLGATIESVDTAMKVWAESYVKRRNAAATEEAKTKLDNEFNLVTVAKAKYNTAMQVVFGSIEQAYAVNPNSVTPPDINFTAGNLLTILRGLR